MSLEPISQNTGFITAGPLRTDALYVERPADKTLYQALLAGDVCFVLAPRQIGKSSLRVRTVDRLKEVGVRCAAVELTAGENTEDQWYGWLVRRIWSALELNGDQRTFWSAEKALAPTARFVLFLTDVVLTQMQGPIVIFIDEIETMLSLPFRRDDFFATIRSLYNMRADHAEFRRLTFCLLGVITPGDLIDDPTRTPFNIGREIRVEDFDRRQMDVLSVGLKGLGVAATELLDAIYAWTSGHPYMTLNLCDGLVRKGESHETAAQRVKSLVEQLFLEPGRGDINMKATDSFFQPSLDIPGVKHGNDAMTAFPNLASGMAPEIQPWYLRHRASMLQMYRRLLNNKLEPARDGDPVQMALRLTGIAAERIDYVSHTLPTALNESWGEAEHDAINQGRDSISRLVLKVRNRIFETVFDEEWLKEQETGRKIAEAVAAWENASRSEDYLLRGDQLAEVLQWSGTQQDLTFEERRFLDACRDAEERKAKAEARNARMFRWLSVVSALVSLAAILGWIVAQQKSLEAQANARIARKNEQSARANSVAAKRSEALAKANAIAAAKNAQEAAKNERQAKQNYAEARRQTNKAEVAEIQAKLDRRQAEQAKAKAEQQEQIARAGVYAAWAVLKPGTAKSLQLALEAVDVFRPPAQPTELAKRALRDALLYGLPINAAPGAVAAVAFSHNAQHVVTVSVSTNNIVRIREVAVGQNISYGKPMQLEQISMFHPSAMTLSPDGQKVAVVGWQDVREQSPESANQKPLPKPTSARVLLYDTATGKRVWQWSAPRFLSTSGGPIVSLAFSADGRQVIGVEAINVTPSEQPIPFIVHLWDTQTGITRKFDLDQQLPLAAVGNIACAQNGRVVGMVFKMEDKSKVIGLWDPKTGRTVSAVSPPFLVTPGDLSPVALAPNGETVVTSNGDGVKIVRINQAAVPDPNGRQLALSPAGVCVSLAFSPDGKYLAAGTQSGRVQVWETATWLSLGNFNGDSGAVASLAFDEQGNRLVAGSAGGTARIYNVAVLKATPEVLKNLAIANLHGNRLTSAELEQIMRKGLPGSSGSEVVSSSRFLK